MYTTLMSSFISHISAAHSWDIPYLHVVLGYQSAEQLQALVESTPQQRSCLKKSERVFSSDTENHYKTLSLPHSSTVVHNNDLVASPELVFLDMARSLSFHRTVLLGMQLCSSNPARQTPLSTAEKLLEYIERCDGHHGYKVARRAARYVADNSWSVMESLLYMMLTLPHKYGGYGLKGAALNQEIKERRSGTSSQNRLYVADLYWKEAKLVVEYDSVAFHNNARAWMKDAQRATTLERSGYKTLSITTSQLYNAKAFFETAQVIAGILGRRIQIRTPKFVAQKDALRALLPKRELLENV